MNKSLFAVVIATCMSFAAAASESPAQTGGDQGFSRNGYKEHAAVSALAGIIVSNHFENESAVKAWAYAMTPGLIKEVIDSQTKGNHFSGRDMLANALGAAVGVGLGRTLLVTSGGGKTTVSVLFVN